MANKHMKKCLFIGEMQIKTTRRTNITNPEGLKLKRLTMSSVGKDVEELEFSNDAHSQTMLVGYHHFVKQFGSFLRS